MIVSEQEQCEQNKQCLCLKHKIHFHTKAQHLLSEWVPRATSVVSPVRDPLAHRGEQRGAETDVFYILKNLL